MKLFQNTDLKAIALSWPQLCLANAIIQCNMLFIRKPSPEQKTLTDKIQRAKNVVRPGVQQICYFTYAERKRMREFNLEYCCLLVDNIEGKVKRGSDVTDGLEAYMLATAIQLKFRP